MEEPTLTRRVHASKPPFFKRGDDQICLFFLEVANDKEGYVHVQQHFLKELDKLPAERKKLLLNYLALYMMDEFRFQTDPDFWFHDDFEGFQQYAQSTYKDLNAFQQSLIVPFIKKQILLYFLNPKHWPQILSALRR